MKRINDIAALIAEGESDNNQYMRSLQLSWDARSVPEENLDALSVSKIESFIDKVNESGRFSLDPSPLIVLEKLTYRPLKNAQSDNR